jgi:hypothetical protein
MDSSSSSAYNTDDSSEDEDLTPTPIDMKGLTVVSAVPLGLLSMQDCNDLRSLMKPLQVNSASTMETITSLEPLQVTCADEQALSSDPWHERFLELLDYKHRFGHVNVPYDFPANRPLSQWVKRQRHQYKLKQMGRHSNLSEDRELMLQSIGYVWDSRGAHWDERFQDLKDFYEEHGHARVTKTNPKYRQLAVWLKRQRHHARLLLAGDTKSTGMTSQRIFKMVQLGVKIGKPAASTSS